MVENWIKYCDKNQLKNMVEEGLHTAVGTMSLYYDENYGKAYYFMFSENMQDISGEEGFGIKLGNFGGVKTDLNTNNLTDSFDMLRLSPEFVLKYVRFVAEQNMVDGEPRKINGLTYGESFANKLSSHIKSLKKKKLFKALPEEKLSEIGLFEKMLDVINGELAVIEKRETGSLEK